jgi:hypothetical protein
MKVFISYSQESAALAKKVRLALEQAGFDAWDQQEHIYPGDNWAEKLGQALNESEAMVVLVTQEALSSMNVRRDISFALGQQAFSNRLIPVLIGDDGDSLMEKMPWILRTLNVIKLPGSKQQEEGIDRIAQALQAVA